MKPNRNANTWKSFFLCNSLSLTLFIEHIPAQDAWIPRRPTLVLYKLFLHRIGNHLTLRQCTAHQKRFVIFWHYAGNQSQIFIFLNFFSNIFLRNITFIRHFRNFKIKKKIKYTKNCYRKKFLVIATTKKMRLSELATAAVCCVFLVW